MKSIYRLVRFIFTGLVMTFLGYVIIPAFWQAAENMVPGFNFSWAYLFSIYGFSTALVLCISLIGCVGVLLLMALKLSDWVFTSPVGVKHGH